MKIRLLIFSSAVAAIFTLSYTSSFAQAPSITYTPSTNVYTLNTAITPLSPANAGGAVASFAYGPGTQPTGGAFNNPYGMGTDPSGNIYVINYSNNTISKYSSATGTFVSNNFFTGGTLSNPAGIAFDNAGNAYILNYNHTNNGLGNNHGNAYVEQYNSSGAYVSTIVQGLGTATGIAIDLNNNIYIAEGSYNGGGQTVAQYNTSGQLAFSLSSTQITNPIGVGVDGAGNIYVLDDTFNDVVKFNSAGTYLSTVITSAQLGTNGNILGIYVDGAGNIYIGNSGTGGAAGNTSGSVKVYNSSGTLLVSKTGLNDPEGVVTDNKGNMYVSDYTNNTVTRYPPVGGYYLSGLLPAGLSFSYSTGTFSGTPTTPFNATTYTVTAYNASGSNSTTVTLSCPPNLSAPDISYNPPINVFTTNTAITALSPTNIGGTPTSSYTISPTTLTANTGLTFSSSTGIFSGTPTKTSVATVYTVTVSNASGSSSTKVSIACVVDNFWNGSKSSDWNTKQNWSANRVPISTDLASIGVVSYAPKPDPIITANTTAYNVTFGPNAGNFTVQTGATFTINNYLAITATATQNFVGTGTGAINIAPAAYIEMFGSGQLAITNPSSTVNLVTLQSDITGSATVSQLTTGSITGTVNVQRFITGGAGYRGYRLLSSPVYATTVSSNNVYSVNYLINSCYVKGTTGSTGGFDNPAGNPTIFLFRENLAPSNSSFTSGNFRGINNITTSPTYSIDNDAGTYNIPAGNGYLFFFRGDRNVGKTLAQESLTTYPPTSTTLTASGTLNQGPITVYDWYTPSSANLGYTTTSGSTSIEGFNLVGNPYASSIDWDTYSATATGSGIYAPNVGPFMYELDPLSQNYSVYKSGNGGVGTIAKTQANVIPSGHGFFVIAANTSAQLVFNETSKISTQATTTIGNLLLGKPVLSAETRYLDLKLLKDSLSADGTIINFDNNAKPGFDNKKDALYKAGNGTSSLFSFYTDNIPLAISTLPLPTQIPLSINLNVNTSVSGTYQLNLAAVKGIPQLFDIWLIDALKGDSSNLRQNPIYSFDISTTDPASYGAKRFILVIRQNPSLAVQLLSFSAAKVADGAQITWRTKNEQNYTNFTVERSTNSGAFEAVNSTVSSSLGTYSFLDETKATNGTYMYRLKLEDLNGVIGYSNVVTLMYGKPSDKINSNISVYPNPVSNIINLSIGPNTQSNTDFSPLPSESLVPSLSSPASHEGVSYLVKIVNITGTVVKTLTLKTTTWQDNVSGLVPGTYFVQVINNKDNSVVGKMTFIKL